MTCLAGAKMVFWFVGLALPSLRGLFVTIKSIGSYAMTLSELRMCYLLCKNLCCKSVSDFSILMLNYEFSATWL